MSKELYGKTIEEWEEYYTQNPNSSIVADKYIIVLKSKLKEAEEKRLFFAKQFTKEKRRANNAIYKLNKLKGFSEVEDSFNSFCGRSYINIRYTNKTVLEIQSIRNMILDLNQQHND